jgi:hypothetical protein
LCLNSSTIEAAMSRHQNNFNRKLRSALTRSLRSSLEPKAPVQKKPPVNNFRAKVSDGYVIGACHQRPAPGVAQAHRDEIVAREEAERQETVRCEERIAAEVARQEQLKREQMVTRQQVTMQNGRIGTHKRIMLGAVMLGMMDAQSALRRS